MTDVLQTLSREMLPALEQELQSVLQVDGTPPDKFYGMMHYHMGWVDADLRPTQINAGKRIRPAAGIVLANVPGGRWSVAAGVARRRRY
jgi:geranylgeranyl diphosphate synthase type I